MLETFKDQNIRAACCQPIVGISEKYYEYREALLQAGWDSYLPGYRLQESFCSKELISIQEQRMLAIHKAKIAHNPFAVEPETSREKELRTQWKLDRPTPLCEFVIKRLRVNDPIGYINLVWPYAEDQSRLRKQEILRHVMGDYKDFQDSTTARIQVFKAVMSRHASDLGFTLDKTLSLPRSPVYSKEFLAPWRLCLFIDEIQDLACTPGQLPLNEIEVPPEVLSKMVQAVSSSQGQDVNDKAIQVGWKILKANTLPHLTFAFGLVHNKNRGVAGDMWRRLTFRCEWFFPIGGYPFHSFYKRFRSFAELELVVLFHLKMYKLVQNDFEKNLYKGLADAIELYNGMDSK